MQAIGGGNPDLELAYESSLQNWLGRYKRYPNIAKRRGQEDTIMLKFTIDR